VIAEWAAVAHQLAPGPARPLERAELALIGFRPTWRGDGGGAERPADGPGQAAGLVDGHGEHGGGDA
jgi:hypothetical protein